MPTSSAVPADLDGYVTAAAGATPRVTRAAADLKEALDAFRATEGRSAFVADVPEVDLGMTFLAQRWDGLAAWLSGVSRAFRAADGGDGGALTVDDAVIVRHAGRWTPPEVEVLHRDGRVVLDTGGGDDEVVIIDGEAGIVVVVNGTTYRVPGATADTLLRTGGGDDTVNGFNGSLTGSLPTQEGLEVDAGRGHDLVHLDGGGAVIRGGAGDDDLRGGSGADRIIGGAGDDRLWGDDGTDRLLGGDGGDVVDSGAGDDWASGGAGDDLLYGEDGDDRLTGGDGRDHIDGGAGNDQVDGGAGADIVSGGEGHDTVDGGAGDDVLYAGPGADLVRGGSGADALHLEEHDRVDGVTDDDTVLRREVDLSVVDAITIGVADPDLEARIRSDLVTLASTDAGAALLAGLVEADIRIVVRFDDPEADAAFATDAYDPKEDTLLYRLGDDEPGFGADPGGDLSYSPLVALHHELVHAHDDLHGTGADGVYLGEDPSQIPTVARPDTDPSPYASSRDPDEAVRLDLDRDGVVTRDELYVALDRNGDGELSDDEIDLSDDGFVNSVDGFINNSERQTVGLPIDHDRDPATPDVAPAHPDLNENSLRRELGLPTRDGYTLP